MVKNDTGLSISDFVRGGGSVVFQRITNSLMSFHLVVVVESRWVLMAWQPLENSERRVGTGSFQVSPCEHRRRSSQWNGIFIWL